MMFNIKISNLLLLLFFFFTCRLSAQHEMDFEDWRKFGPIPKNWKIVGAVSANWDHDDFLSTTPGTGVLVNAAKTKNSKHLISGFEHGDIEVEFDYMVPKGSNSGIYLQGRYEVQIFDSWGKVNPSFADAGGIYQRYDEKTQIGFEGVPPRMNVSKAPGLWQNFKIIFEAPRFSATGEKVKNAKFVQVFQNRILVQVNIPTCVPFQVMLT